MQNIDCTWWYVQWYAQQQKIVTNDNRAITQKQENKHFSCFYYKILFCSTKKYKTNFNVSFYFESCKKARAPKDFNQWFLGYWI